MNHVYDLAIIGAGPAGLSASIYASRYKLEHLIFGASQGGQMNEIYDLENWPGERKISGHDLISKFVEHAESFGAKINRESVAGISKLEDGTFQINCAKNIYKTRAIILAMGAHYRKMNIPGEKEFTGRGVSYCATCDAMFFREKTVCVIGGGPCDPLARSREWPTMTLKLLTTLGRRRTKRRTRSQKL